MPGQLSIVMDRKHSVWEGGGGNEKEVLRKGMVLQSTENTKKGRGNER
jgi:hypothetical protein